MHMNIQVSPFYGLTLIASTPVLLLLSTSNRYTLIEPVHPFERCNQLLLLPALPLSQLADKMASSPEKIAYRIYRSLRKNAMHLSKPRKNFMPIEIQRGLAEQPSGEGREFIEQI